MVLPSGNEAMIDDEEAVINEESVINEEQVANPELVSKYNHLNDLIVGAFAQKNIAVTWLPNPPEISLGNPRDWVQATFISFNINTSINNLVNQSNLAAEYARDFADNELPDVQPFEHVNMHKSFTETGMDDATGVDTATVVYRYNFSQ